MYQSRFRLHCKRMIDLESSLSESSLSSHTMRIESNLKRYRSADVFIIFCFFFSCFFRKIFQINNYRQFNTIHRTSRRKVLILRTHSTLALIHNGNLAISLGQPTDFPLLILDLSCCDRGHRCNSFFPFLK